MQKDTILKKLAITLLTLTAISSAALASDRNYDLRDSDTYYGKYATRSKATNTSTNAVAIEKDEGVLTNFERTLKISNENQHGGH